MGVAAGGAVVVGGVVIVVGGIVVVGGAVVVVGGIVVVGEVVVVGGAVVVVSTVFVAAPDVHDARSITKERIKSAIPRHFVVLKVFIFNLLLILIKALLLFVSIILIRYLQGIGNVCYQTMVECRLMQEGRIIASTDI
jgi:hypothetical protein